METFSEFSCGEHKCFCDLNHKNADNRKTCGDCPRDYIPGAWAARLKYLDERSPASTQGKEPDASPVFRFEEFNPHRAARGTEAARVVVIENGEENWLWMSRTDIARNIMIYGQNPELMKAHTAYGSYSC